MAGLAIGAWNYMAQPPVTTQTDVVFYFYSNGTTDFAPAVVADQFVTKLTGAGFEIATRRGNIPVVASLVTASQFETLPQVVDAFEMLIDAHVDERLVELRQWTQDKVPDALALYLRYQSYRDGRSSGTIDLVDYKTVRTDTERRGIVSKVAPPAIVGLFVGLGLGLILFFISNWRRAR
ncbi:MAG: hypothetical protein EOO38_07980 [Cytophagaceae bacterium]|nr:MAG: hypothetical protein EOO38_07980 [Cytophagaceae bacterium]